MQYLQNNFSISNLAFSIGADTDQNLTDCPREDLLKFTVEKLFQEILFYWMHLEPNIWTWDLFLVPLLSYCMTLFKSCSLSVLPLSTNYLLFTQIAPYDVSVKPAISHRGPLSCWRSILSYCFMISRLFLFPRFCASKHLVHGSTADAKREIRAASSALHLNNSRQSARRLRWPSFPKTMAFPKIQG